MGNLKLVLNNYRSGFWPSSTLLSSWVTLTASLSILACKELALSLKLWASLASSPNKSSACLDKLDSCLMVLASVPFVAASNSDGRGKSSGMVPRATCTGSTNRFGSGILSPEFFSTLWPAFDSPFSRHLQKTRSKLINIQQFSPFL